MITTSCSRRNNSKSSINAHLTMSKFCGAIHILSNMTTKTFRATISADGKLEDGSCLKDLKSGDKIQLTINGQKMLGGKGRETLIGNTVEFLPRSHRLELIQFEPRRDGTCRLTYNVL